MLDATIDLQAQVYKALAENAAVLEQLGGARVFDRVPEKAAFPYIVLGRSTVSDWSTATEDGEAIVFFIHVWSNDTSRAQSHALQRAVKDTLAANLQLQDHHLINLRFQLAETRRDHVNEYFHTVMRFRAVTEPR